MLTLPDAADRVFLALMIWREARGEPLDGQLAVGFTVVERIRSGIKWWGTDVLSALFTKYQYSSLTAMRDPQLTTWPFSGDRRWQKCLSIADLILSGQAKNPAPGADSYYDISIKPPSWATTDKHVVDIGRLRFFKVGATE